MGAPLIVDITSFGKEFGAVVIGTKMIVIKSKTLIRKPFFPKKSFFVGTLDRLMKQKKVRWFAFQPTQLSLPLTTTVCCNNSSDKGRPIVSFASLIYVPWIFSSTGRHFYMFEQLRKTKALRIKYAKYLNNDLLPSTF